MNKARFIGRIVPTMIEAGVSVHISQKATINRRYLGWFDGERKLFRVANGCTQAFAVMVHEYNHFLQWRDDRKLWHRCATTESEIEIALDGANEITDRMIRNVIAIEHDCDVRSLEMIDDLQLDIDAEQYAARTNAYLMMYHMMRHVGRAPRKYPTEIRAIVDTMPRRLYNLSYYLDPKNISDQAIDLMLTHCFYDTK